MQGTVCSAAAFRIACPANLIALPSCATTSKKCTQGSSTNYFWILLPFPAAPPFFYFSRRNRSEFYCWALGVDLCVHVCMCMCVYVCVYVYALCRSAGARPSANTSANDRHAKNARAPTPCVGAQLFARMVARNLAARRALAAAPAFVHMDGSAATARLFSFLSFPLVFPAALSCFCCVFPHVLSDGRAAARCSVPMLLCAAAGRN